MRKVIKKSPIPIYYQLKEIIVEMIENEELEAHDLIPTERELCKIHDISRMTVRMAIMTLVNEGVLYREQGKGTFVATQKPKHQLSRLKGLTEDMQDMGHKVDTKVLSFKKVPSSKIVAKNLNLNAGDDALEIQRLRIVNDTPYAIETAWFNPAKVPNLKRADIEGRSLYEILREEYSIVPKYAKQTVDPIQLNEAEKEMFELEGDSLALLFHRSTYTENEEIFEYTKGIYRIDKHKFEIYLEI